MEQSKIEVGGPVELKIDEELKIPS